MEIEIKQKVICQGRWNSKWYGVILVKTQEDKDKLFDLLLAQDNYWEQYSHRIKVIPEKGFTSFKEIENLCDYCGKTDIYKIDEIKKQVDFIIYQYYVNRSDF